MVNKDKGSFIAEFETETHIGYPELRTLNCGGEITHNLHLLL